MRHTIILTLALCAALSAQALELSLEQCRRMALESDESVRIAGNNALGADLDRAVARTAYLPQFAANGTVMYSAPDSKMGDMMTTQMRGAYMAGITLTQPLYAGGKIVAANRLAAVGQQISHEQLRAARMDVATDAEKSYWTYVAVLAKVRMMESYMSMMDSVYDVTELSVRTGMAPQQTLLRVDSRRSEVIYRLEQARAGADICRMALCRTIGVADTVTIVPTETVDGILPVPARDTDVDSRPETVMLQKAIDVRRHQVTMTRADFLPVVGVQLGWSAYGNIKMNGWTQDPTGNYVPMSMNYKSNGFMGLLSVQVPLFHWGEGIKKVKRARLDVDNARLTLEHNRRLMQLEASQNYNNLVTGTSLVTAAETAMNEAAENLRIMREQYRVGMTTLTDLLEAQSQWHTSYSNLIEARTQCRIYRVDYLRSVGRLDD